MLSIYMSSEHKLGAAPARSRARVGRVIYVCDSVAEAKRDLRDAELVHAHMRMQHVIPPGGSNADLTFEKLIDRGFFICGDPDTVYDGIKNVYDEVGGFGTLLLIYGKDWGTLEQRCRSMERFMAEVAPRLAALDPDKSNVASAAE
jgi:alkanesulfonate monooxygenase SsuD/methylene tetrahydromethanopterin reductase-like flavin-dependent oxidoreductase (luciferase family)